MKSSELLLIELVDKINKVYDLLLKIKNESDDNQLKEDLDTFLDVPEVSKLSHYTEQTIRTKVMLNEIPSFKMNGRRLFRKSEIMKWIASGGK